MPSAPLKITVLGSGTSMGVPTLGCPCRVCKSSDHDDKPTLSTVPSVTLDTVQSPFELLGIPFIPVPLLHGELEVLGFRFGRAAYLTDFSKVPDSSMALLQGLDELVLDALRDIPHPM